MVEKIGTEEGQTCYRPDHRGMVWNCPGLIQLEPLHGCTCHCGMPPCNACTSRQLHCPVCGWRSDEEEDEPATWRLDESGDIKICIEYLKKTYPRLPELLRVPHNLTWALVGDDLSKDCLLWFEDEHGDGDFCKFDLGTTHTLGMPRLLVLGRDRDWLTDFPSRVALAHAICDTRLRVLRERKAAPVPGNAQEAFDAAKVQRTIEQYIDIGMGSAKLIGDLLRAQQEAEEKTKMYDAVEYMRVMTPDKNPLFTPGSAMQLLTKEQYQSLVQREEWMEAARKY